MRTKLKVIFMQSINGTYLRVGSKMLRAGKKDIRFRKHAYVVDINKPVYRSRNTVLYFMDVDPTRPGQIETGTAMSPVSADLIDAILEQELPRQFANKLTKSKGIDGSVVLLIAICAMAGFLGFFIGLVFQL